jgi:hypothetical protein
MPLLPPSGGNSAEGGELGLIVMGVGGMEDGDPGGECRKEYLALDGGMD